MATAVYMRHRALVLSNRRAAVGRRPTFNFSRDWLALLEISQDRDTGGGGDNVLERMTAQKRSDRINRVIIELEQLSKGV